MGLVQFRNVGLGDKRDHLGKHKIHRKGRQADVFLRELWTVREQSQLNEHWEAGRSEKRSLV